MRDSERNFSEHNFSTDFTEDVERYIESNRRAEAGSERLVSFRVEREQSGSL